MPDQNQILFQTKLHQPPIIRGMIERPQLLEQLNRGINCPLTLVIASAGFGKTTLVANWLELMAADQSVEASSFPTAWLSLDERDSDLELFISYLIAALRTIFTNACEATLALLQATQQVPLDILYATLSNEIDQLSMDFILVLDDYHTLHGTEVHGLLIELARHWPKRLHLVLISRMNPSIPLAKLRAGGMINEIRTSDLRFTVDEMTAYLSQAQIAPMPQAALRLLEERFEGWIAGLHLAALSLRSAGSIESVLSVLSSENPNITGYLLDEVFIRQFPAIYSFLLKTSILDRFCTELCAAVMGKVDSSWNIDVCLDWIERSELFIIPLDRHRKWYRYHQLFQESLQQRLTAEIKPDQVANLHRLASAWFAENGLVDEALQHALAAGDIDLAVRQMSAGLCEVINRQDRTTLGRWLRLLPEETIQRSPHTLMIRVWSLQFSWRIDLQIQVLKQVEKLLASAEGASLPADDQRLLCGQILGVKAQHAYLSNQTTQAIDLCREALALLPPSWTYARGGAMLYLGMSICASGQALAAERLLLDEYDANSHKTDIYALQLLVSQGFNYLNNGQLQHARKISQLLLKGAIRSGLTINMNWGDFYLGVVHYHLNELDFALQHFSNLAENHFTTQMSTYRDAVAGLALIHQIQGQSAEARQLVESLSLFDLEERGSEDPRTSSLRARLQLMQGDLESAGRWVDSFTSPPLDRPLLWLEEPQVTRVRVLVARGANADLRLALQILDVLDEIVEKTHNTRVKIEILALRALAVNALGDFNQANAALIQSLDLAQMGGFIRVFVDLGNPMKEMLHRLAQQDHLIEAIRRILAAFPAEFSLPESSPPAEYSQPGDKNPFSSAHYPTPGNSILVDPLTPREFEILVLLREPLSIKEIARKLNISYATVKRHNSTIYGKLDVQRRWDAVARAEALRVLPQR
jgi:LuxR family maltose regulon positive regulatory protein